MMDINQLRDSIENTREELDALFLNEDFKVYYEKSKELDRLIEMYLDMEEAYEEEDVVLA